MKLVKKQYKVWQTVEVNGKVVSQEWVTVEKDVLVPSTFKRLFSNNKSVLWICAALNLLITISVCLLPHTLMWSVVLNSMLTGSTIHKLIAELRKEFNS